MKIIKQRISLVAISMILLLIASCNDGMQSLYYYQQQSRSAMESNPPQLEESSGAAQTLSGINPFSIILPKGEFLEKPSENENSEMITTVKKRVEDARKNSTYSLSPDKFKTWKFKVIQIENKLPQSKLDGEINWVQTDECETYDGESFKAEGYSTSSIVYSKYSAKNPFGLYKDDKYVKYSENGDQPDKEELMMQRFVFYKFTGTASIATLNSYLFAVDTYSGLVFAYAKPLEFTYILGNKNPKLWGSVDNNSVSEVGKLRFYEYDPIGYITDQGEFVFTEAYKANQSKENYDPEFTANAPKSPYYNLNRKVPEVKGTLKIKAKYLENISVTDQWGGDPEFCWDIKSRAYILSKDTANKEWHSLDKQLDSLYYNIHKGKIQTFSSSEKTYVFNGEQGCPILELTSDIVEVDGSIKYNEPLNNNRWLSEHEKPIISFKYEDKCWKFDRVTNGKAEYTEDFIVETGEASKEFAITFTNGSWQMKLCYEISWSEEN